MTVTIVPHVILAFPAFMSCNRLLVEWDTVQGFELWSAGRQHVMRHTWQWSHYVAGAARPESCAVIYLIYMAVWLD